MKKPLQYFVALHFVLTVYAILRMISDAFTFGAVVLTSSPFNPLLGYPILLLFLAYGISHFKSFASLRAKLSIITFYILIPGYFIYLVAVSCFFFSVVFSYSSLEGSGIVDLLQYIGSSFFKAICALVMFTALGYWLFPKYFDLKEKNKTEGKIFNTKPEKGIDDMNTDVTIETKKPVVEIESASSETNHRLPIWGFPFSRIYYFESPYPIEKIRELTRGQFPKENEVVESTYFLFTETKENYFNVDWLTLNGLNASLRFGKTAEQSKQLGSYNKAAQKFNDASPDIDLQILPNPIGTTDLKLTIIPRTSTTVMFFCFLFPAFFYLFAFFYSGVTINFQSPLLGSIPFFLLSIFSLIEYFQFRNKRRRIVKFLTSYLQLKYDFSVQKFNF